MVCCGNRHLCDAMENETGNSPPRKASAMPTPALHISRAALSAPCLPRVQGAGGVGKAAAAPSAAARAARWRKLEGQAADLRAACEAVAHSSKEMSREAKAQAAALHQAARAAETVPSTAAREAALAALQQQEQQLRRDLEAAQGRLQAVMQQSLQQTAASQTAPPSRSPPAGEGSTARPKRGEEHPPPGKPRRGAPTTTSTSAAASDLPLEVSACNDFLARHGAGGGWEGEDHSEFLRVLRACRGNYAHCVELCCEGQLGLLHGRQAVAQHARWHEELEALQMAKRLAVQQWRLRKKAAQEALLEGQKPVPSEVEQRAAKQAELAQRQAQEREQQRVALAEWRQQREEERRREVEQAAAERAAAEERARQEWQARQQHNQQTLEGWRQQRLMQEGSCASARSSSSAYSAPVDLETRQRLQERNHQLLERRRMLESRRSEQEAEKEARLARLRASATAEVAPLTPRDPGRLLQPTAAAQLRQLSMAAEERTPRDSGYIRHVPRRATPAWRKAA
eukprot:scaffold1.g5673.t1